MKRASRPKPPCAGGPAPLGTHSSDPPGLLAASAAWAQVASSYATRDGRVLSYVLSCVSTDGSFTAQPCGVGGYPLHVMVDNTATGTPTTAPGTASSQLLGIQGGGPGALPVSVTDTAIAQVVVQAQLAAAALGTPGDAAASGTGTVVAQLRAHRQPARGGAQFGGRQRWRPVDARAEFPGDAGHHRRIAALAARRRTGRHGCDGGHPAARRIRHPRLAFRHLCDARRQSEGRCAAWRRHAPVSVSAMPLPAGAATPRCSQR